MRLVIAVLRPAQMEAVRQALAAVHVTRLTVCDGQGVAVGDGGGISQQTMLQVAVNEDFLARTVDTIRSVLAAGQQSGCAESAGGVFVLPVAEAVQIYREVRGPEAI